MSRRSRRRQRQRARHYRRQQLELQQAMAGVPIPVATPPGVTAAAARYASAALFLATPVLVGTLPAQAVAGVLAVNPLTPLLLGATFVGFQYLASQEPDTMPRELRQLSLPGLLVLDLVLMIVGVGLAAVLGAASFRTLLGMAALVGYVRHQRRADEEDEREGVTFLPTRVTVGERPREAGGIHFLEAQPAAPSPGPEEGPECGYCAVPLAADEARRTCRRCGIHHHEDCWKEAGGCTTYGCAG